MRFCPFCSAENLDESSECVACARRLPPLPPRRRKNGLEKTVELDTAKDESKSEDEAGGLGAKKKGLGDIASSPSSSRRGKTQPPPTPAGVVERRKATASPDSRGGRRQTAPPVPSRAARDLRASLSTGVAPGLASESIPLPDLSGRAGGTGSGSQPYIATITPTSTPVVSTTPAEVTPASSVVSSTPDSTPVPTPAEVASVDEEWPAPVTTAAPHPDDWGLEPEASVSNTAAINPTQLAPVIAEAQVNPTGATEMVGTLTRPAVPHPTTVPQPTPAAPAAPSVPTAHADERSGPTVWPPATRVVPLEEPFKIPELMPIPGVPEAGLWKALKYTLAFERAKWQRRGAIKSLRSQMREDTGMLDGILGALGKQTRSLGINGKALESENRAIDEAEKRRKTADHECSELSNRQAEENSKFADSENERQAKVGDSDSALDTAQAELGANEAQRKGLREEAKSLETRKKNYLKAAEGRDTDSAKAENSASRLELRQGAQSLRTDAADLDKQRQDIERRIAALEKPIAQSSARVGALKSDLESAKRALTDLREGHRHRLAEIEAGLGKRTRELAQSEAEIQRREVTLGTLVNLNRIERPEFQELYGRIDGLRGGIGARSNEIDKLSAEREAYDKASRIRGAFVLAGVVVLFIALLAILLSLS